MSRKFILSLITTFSLGSVEAFAGLNRPVDESEVIYKSSVVVTQEVAGVGKGTCTGTLISSNVILTAAHCVAKILSSSPKIIISKEPADIKSVEVIFGNSNPLTGTSENKRRLVEVIKIHPEFNNSHVEDLPTNDIALIKIVGVAPKDFIPATLLANSSFLKTDSPVTVVGFGNNLPHYNLSLFDTEILSVEFESVGAISIKTDLESNKIGSVYHGYSGGPATTLIAGKSFVWGVCSGGWKAVMTYESVPFYLPWIRDAISEMSGVDRLRFFSSCPAKHSLPFEYKPNFSEEK